MSTAFASIKLSSDLVEQARRDAPVFSRSIAGQVEHWARLGQALESAPGFTLDRVRAALDGRLSAADLTEDEWRVYDELAWEAMAQPSATAIKFFDELRRTPGTVGEDEHGNLVRVAPDGTLQALADT